MSKHTLPSEGRHPVSVEQTEAETTSTEEKEKQLLSGFFKVYSLFESMGRYTEEKAIQIQSQAAGAPEDLAGRFSNNSRELKILFSRFFHSKQIQDIFKQRLGQEIRSSAKVDSLRQTLLEPFFETHNQSKPHIDDDWRNRSGNKELSVDELEAISLIIANPDWEKTIQKLAYLPGEHQEDVCDYLKSPNPWLALKLLKFGNPSLAVRKSARFSNLEMDYDKSDSDALEDLLLKVQEVIRQVKEVIPRGAGVEIISAEHAEVLSEIFKGETLDEITLPTPEELTDEYFAKMYPEEQSKYDSENELINKRGSWWKDTADANFTISEKEEKQSSGKKKRATWGELFVASMKSEAAQLQGSILFTESIQKPNYTDGSQQYGSKDGVDATLDPLLPIIREVFGEKANRFKLSWDKINAELIPKVKEKITEKFTTKGLPIPNFDVILTPALVSNLQTTLNHPANSQTSTSEWSSTPLLKQDNTDSGHRLVVGNSGRGGTGCVFDLHRGDAWGSDGFRLSVVFKKH